MQLILAATLLLVFLATSSASDAAAGVDSSSSSNDLERELQASLAAASAGQPASSSGQASSDKHAAKDKLQHEQQQRQHEQQADHKPRDGSSSRQHKQPLKVRETKEHAVSRQELRELFKKLLTDSERRSLSVRIDPAEVKRTINEMKDQVRYSYDRSASKRKAAAAAAAAGPASGSEHSHAAVSAERKKKQQQQQQHQHHQQLQQRALRMRRSLLANSQESVMASKRARRRKRDLPDYSPEDYEALLRELAADEEGLGDDEGEGYQQDADGAIRLLDQPLPLLQEQRRSMPPPPPPEPFEDLDDSVEDNVADNADGLYDLPPSAAAALLMPPPPLPQEDAGIEEPWLPAPAENFDSSDDDSDDAVGEVNDDTNRPLTMFLVRVAGERGLFLPLDQRAAASAASAIANGQLAVSDQEFASNEPEEGDELLRAAAAEEGQRELRRFAEKLARSLPAEQLL